MDHSSITKHQTDTGSLTQQQDSNAVIPKCIKNKPKLLSESVATLNVIDEHQQKTADGWEVLATADTTNGYDSVGPSAHCDGESQGVHLRSCGYQQVPASGSPQQPIAGKWAVRKGETRDKRANGSKPRQMVELDHRLSHLVRAEGYRYEAFKKLHVRRYSKPVYICIAILFFISMASMANIWILQCEVNRLTDEMRRTGLSWEDHGWMETGRQLNETKDKPVPEDDFQHLSGALDIRPQAPSDVLLLSRGIRQAKDPKPAKAGGKSKSKAKGKERKGKGQTKRKKKGKGKNLQVELYVGSWSTEYNPEHGKLCGQNHNLPGHPTTCFTQCIVYHKEGSIVAFFQKDETWTPVRKKKKHITTLLKLNSKGQFVVQTAGTFLLHFNMTLKDKTISKSIGVFLNGGILFACPPGGTRCPLTNEADTKHFRLCTAHGVAKLEVNDVVDIRTMDEDVTIKVKLPSQFWAVLLAKHPGS